jgi:hypothetical protein
VVFYGSSSIRLWNTLADDFPGVPAARAGPSASARSVELLPRTRALLSVAPAMEIGSVGFYCNRTVPENRLFEGKTAAVRYRCCRSDGGRERDRQELARAVPHQRSAT